VKRCTTAQLLHTSIPRVLIACFFGTTLFFHTGCSSKIKHQTIVQDTVSFAELLPFALASKHVYGGEGEAAYLDSLTSHWDVYIDSTALYDIRYYLLTHRIQPLQMIVVRGTKTRENILTDAEYIKRDDTLLGVWLHKGFDRATRELYETLAPRLAPDAELLITGHSLGGAITAILAMEAVADSLNLKQVITFGQPKVTNKAGVEKYRFLPLIRVVDERDLVPLVPPLTLVSAEHGAYRHFGPEVRLLQGPYYSYVVEVDSEKVGVDSFWENLGNGLVKDHNMDLYVQRIASKVAQSKQVPFNQRLKYETN